MKEKSVSQCKVKDRTLERHKGAAPTLTSATYKGNARTIYSMRVSEKANRKQFAARRVRAA